MRLLFTPVAVVVSALLVGCSPGGTAVAGSQEAYAQSWEDDSIGPPARVPAVDGFRPCDEDRWWQPRTGLLPASVTVTRLSVCGSRQFKDRQGEWVVERVITVEEDLAGLNDALHRPDAPDMDGICPLVLRGVPVFVVQDAQGVDHYPRLPREPCGPETSLIALDEAIERGQVAERRHRVGPGVKPVDRCSGGVPDFDSLPRRPSAPAPALRMPPGHRNFACVHDGAGRFADGYRAATAVHSLSEEGIRTFAERISPPRACRASGSAYVHLHPNRTTPSAYIEMGGCWRVIGNGVIGHTTQSDVQALLASGKHRRSDAAGG